MSSEKHGNYVDNEDGREGSFECDTCRKEVSWDPFEEEYRCSNCGVIIA